MVNRVPNHLVWPSRHLLHRKMTKEKFKEDIKYYFFSFIKISKVTSKQNFIENYYRLVKNLYNENCLWKNEVNVSRVSEISKIHSLYGFTLLQPTLDPSSFEQHLQEAPQTLQLLIIQPIRFTSASIWFEKLYHKGIRLNNVCVQWVFAIIYFPILINFWLFIVFTVNNSDGGISVYSGPSSRHLPYMCSLWTCYPSKHLLVFKTSWRCLQDILKMSSSRRWRLLQDVLKTCLGEDVLKTCLQDLFKTCLQDLFKTSCRQTKCSAICI